MSAVPVLRRRRSARRRAARRRRAWSTRSAAAPTSATRATTLARRVLPGRRPGRGQLRLPDRLPGPARDRRHARSSSESSACSATSPGAPTCSTLDDSDVWTARRRAISSTFVDGEPAAARQLLAALARQVQEHQAFADDLLFLDLKGRVAKRLLQMGTLVPRRSARPTAPPSRAITHADLASLCGGSRENVTRILSDFQRRGLVQARRPSLRAEEGPAQLASDRRGLYAGLARGREPGNVPDDRDRPAPTSTVDAGASERRGSSVSVPTSSTTTQRSFAGFASTSATVPSSRPDSVRTVAALELVRPPLPSGRAPGARTRARGARSPRGASAAVRSSISSKVTSSRAPCGRSGPHRQGAAVRRRTRSNPGPNGRGCRSGSATATSPRTPCALVTRPTTTVGSSTSVLEVDADRQVLARRRPRGRRCGSPSPCGRRGRSPCPARRGRP